MSTNPNKGPKISVNVEDSDLHAAMHAYAREAIVTVVRAELQSIVEKESIKLPEKAFDIWRSQWEGKRIEEKFMGALHEALLKHISTDAVWREAVTRHIELNMHELLVKHSPESMIDAKITQIVSGRFSHLMTALTKLSTDIDTRYVEVTRMRSELEADRSTFLKQVREAKSEMRTAEDPT